MHVVAVGRSVLAGQHGWVRVVASGGCGRFGRAGRDSMPHELTMSDASTYASSSAVDLRS